MPNIKSQKKRVITNAKAQTANKAEKSNLKSTIKKADAAVSTGDEARKAVVANAFSTIDKAAKKNVIHKNNANRKKAALAKLTADSEK